MQAEQVIDRLSQHKNFDIELWDFVEEVQYRRLVNLTDSELRQRLRDIDKNICFLEPTPQSRLMLNPDRGWLSPSYWCRLRHWTISEFRHRSLELPEAYHFPEVCDTDQAFDGILRGGEKRLVRISRLPWLKDTLDFGRLRLAPASSYQLIQNDLSRTDDEMRRSSKVPGEYVSITAENGKKIDVLGDFIKSRTRRCLQTNLDFDYWLLSFSTDLDPRLLSDFPSPHGDDGFLVIFDVLEFVRRCVPKLNEIAPLSDKSLEQIEYQDPYYPTYSEQKNLSVRATKEMRFAYQREWRLTVDPSGREVLGNGEAFFLDVGSLSDIAALYAKNGRKLHGAGPSSFWPR
ncbi:hypothetical protein FIU89_16355 [Roseovarius sp. THAF27]|nr:hypothetical protein FIU89_16355 [Roseovarius sp. THAF27]